MEENIEIDNPVLLTDLREIIADIIGQDKDLNGEEITMETSFSHDLELESIEFVVLSEKLQAKYGTELDFTAWLSAKELDEIINLQVKDVVAFISKSQI